MFRSVVKGGPFFETPLPPGDRIEPSGTSGKTGVVAVAPACYLRHVCIVSLTVQNRLPATPSPEQLLREQARPL